jgi:hypothetical protein
MLTTAHPLQRRTIRDASGTLWQIAELDARDVPGALAPNCLVFDSQAICRRYWKYPVDWFELSDVRLLNLMNQSRQSLG